MTPTQTYPTVAVASSQEAPSLAHRAARIVFASLVVAAAAHVAFPLPFTPVPFTLQPLAVLGVGLLLGPVDGALAMLAYLAEGAAGLPVFSPTGLGGLLQLFGPTGGFLLSYPLVAAIAGCSRRAVSAMGAFAAALVFCLLATVVLFSAGAGWLSYVGHLHAHTLWVVAVAPFLPGEVVKAFVAAGIFRATYPLSRARQGSAQQL